MMNKREFRDIAGRFATGVTVMTTKTEQGYPVGMTANSFTTLSITPPLVIFNIGKKVSLFNDFKKTNRFAVNILAANQKELCKQFSTSNIDRFEGVNYEEDVTGAPILHGVIGYFDCVIKERYEGGDHIIIIGEVKGGAQREGDPLIFFKGEFSKLASNSTNRYLEAYA